MPPTRVILMSCGSFNPPTVMHLRMFETARDYLHTMGTHDVVGAVISPTHDDYGKKELATAEHRCAMLKLATQNSDWIRVSTWEARQNCWTKTRLSLQHHQNLLNSILLDTNDTNTCVDIEDLDWIPDSIKTSADRTPIQIKLLCGGDLLESFGKPGVWAEEDIDAIVGQHGLVVITREGSNPIKFVYDSDILSKHMHNIHIVTEYIPNDVSSTKIRTLLKRGWSVRYNVHDAVIEYIYKHGMYGAKTGSTIKLELSTKNGNDYLSIQPQYQCAFLTPSPSDIAMMTPSPIEIITIDLSESVLKKNYQNSPCYSKSMITSDDETERMRDKFINVITENGNKLLASNKTAYPGQAKQIIATETGESQIFREVGLSCISGKFENDCEIDGKSENIEDESSLDHTCKIDDSVKMIDEPEQVAMLDEKSCSVVLDSMKSSKEITPSDSESKFPVILSADVPDASHSKSKEEIPNVEDVEEIENSPREECANSIDVISFILQYSNIITQSPKVVHTAESNDLKDITETDESSQDDESSKKLSNNQPEESKEEQTMSKDSDDTSTPTMVEEARSHAEDAENSEKGSITEESAPRLDTNIEIDGKYLKSLVNSRKSPKKLKSTQYESGVLKNESESSSANSSTSIGERKDEREGPTAKAMVTKSLKSGGPRHGALFQGSLDSINVTPLVTGNSRSRAPISKKSKSYEFIKPTDAQPTTIYKILSADLMMNPGSSCENTSRLKSDTSVFETANDIFEVETDEFCSVCCYANDPSSTEVFYTLRSTESSPLEEDSTECDICSNCDLQENLDTSDSKVVESKAANEPVCEICVICRDVPLDEDVVASSRPEKDEFVDRRLSVARPLPLSLPKKKQGSVQLDSRTFENIDNDDDDDDEEDNFEIDNVGARKISTSGDNGKPTKYKSIDEQPTENTNSNDDEFEIENCGLDIDLDFENVDEGNSRYKAEVEDTFRNFVPRDEIAMSGINSKITRAGSLVSRDTVDRSKTKRRYSSVDNLQNSRQIHKSTPEKQNSLRSRGVVKGLVASADNIRPMRSSRSRSLRKSADDVGRGYHSSMDDMGPLYENIQRKIFDRSDDKTTRDSGTIKMILTKRGIKIISDKETAL